MQHRDVPQVAESSGGEVHEYRKFTANAFYPYGFRENEPFPIDALPRNRLWAAQGRKDW